MRHAFKTKLQQNLEAYYLQKDWILKSNFDKGRDEILVIVPKEENLRALHDSLYDVLCLLPDIAHSPERVVISFCHPDGSGYCSRVINPSKQDEIHLALLGQLPSRNITPTELQNL